MLNALQWLPFMVLSVFIGVAVDRHRRRPLLIVADGGRAAVIGAIVLLAVTGQLSLGLLWGLVFLFGTGTILFELTLPAYVPGLVGTERLMRANTRLQAATTAAQLGGPAFAGLLIQALTAPVAPGLNGVSLFVSVATLSAIRTREALVPAASAIPHPWDELLQGFRVTWRDPYLRSLVPVSACYNLFNEWLLTVYLVYAVRQLHLSPALLGLTLAGGTVGEFLGALVADMAVSRFGLGATFLGAVIVECLAAPMVPITPSGKLLTLPLLVVAFGLMDFGAVLSGVVALSVRQTVTPPRLLGRMTASYRMSSHGVIPVGAAMGGWVGQLLGLRKDMAVVGQDPGLSGHCRMPQSSRPAGLPPLRPMFCVPVAKSYKIHYLTFGAELYRCPGTMFASNGLIVRVGDLRDESGKKPLMKYRVPQSINRSRIRAHT